MRGSVWVKLDVWMVTRTGDKWKNTSEIIYGFSETGELNSNYQREDAYRRTINRALKIYRNTHTLNSDDEINYHKIGDGIQYIGINKEGKKYRTSWKTSKISTAKKRMIHKEVFLGKDKPLTKADIEREVTIEEYRKKHIKELPIAQRKRALQMRESEKYIIRTGFIHKKNVRVKKHNVRNYLGMNNPASKELKLSKKSRPKKNEIFIDKSLKGRKKRQVIAHEVYEAEQMSKGMKYKRAHRKALKIEKKIK